MLHALLPATTTVLGIDEYTACMLSPNEQTGSVYGAGNVTVMRSDAVQVFANGDTFTFDDLRASSTTTVHVENKPLFQLTDATLEAFRQSLRDHQPASAVGYVHSLIELMRQTRESHGDIAHINYMQLMSREMLAALAIFLEEHPLNLPAAAIKDPLVESLMQAIISARADLRANKQYALADGLRTATDACGVEIHDTPQGTVWKRK